MSILSILKLKYSEKKNNNNKRNIYIYREALN